MYTAYIYAEPTNHLDGATSEALVAALANFEVTNSSPVCTPCHFLYEYTTSTLMFKQGAIIAVSHDESFVNHLLYSDKAKDG